ncbi:hypothetical protein OTU49_015609, partial [Cherax quadricarinatus]
IVILRITLEKPAGDLTSALPAAVVVMTPLPLLTALIIYRIYLCCHSDKPTEPQLSATKAEESNQTESKKQEESRDSVLNHQATHSGGVDNPAIDLKEEAV